MEYSVCQFCTHGFGIMGGVVGFVIGLVIAPWLGTPKFISEFDTNISGEESSSEFSSESDSEQDDSSEEELDSLEFFIDTLITKKLAEKRQEFNITPKIANYDDLENLSFSEVFRIRKQTESEAKVYFIKKDGNLPLLSEIDAARKSVRDENIAVDQVFAKENLKDQDEIDRIFYEEDKQRHPDVPENQLTAYYSKRGGGYATNSELENTRNKFGICSGNIFKPTS